MPEPSFVLDAMLGSLARWLRILGYDAIYLQDMPDAEMLVAIRDNDRFLLTRDRQLAARAGERGVLVTSTDIDEQLSAIVERFDLQDMGPRRCTECNGILSSIGKEDLAGHIPEGALEGHDEFWRCAECGKPYWKGAHWKNIRKRIDLVSKGRGNSPR